jgi:hypothetical protein
MPVFMHTIALLSLLWQFYVLPLRQPSLPQSTNNPPALQGIGGYYIVAENASGGTVIGDIVALDRDTTDTLTYTLSMAPDLPSTAALAN